MWGLVACLMGLLFGPEARVWSTQSHNRLTPITDTP